MISACIITKNEELNIESCLKSLDWVSEIIIVDSGSSDRTIELCETYGCNIVRSEWLGFGKTKQLAVNSASNDWIFSIDADEQVSPELKLNIIDILKEPQYKGYRIKRKSTYLGKGINYCGWQDDYPVRLFNKQYGNFDSNEIHEKVFLPDFSLGLINDPILHHPYKNLSQHIEKINLYSELGAKKLKNQRQKFSLIYCFAAGIVKFIKMYFVKKGFLDGRIGLILCSLSAYGVFVKYLKLWILNNDDQRK